MKTLRTGLILIFLFAGAFAIQVAGKTFFVAPNGSPTNNGSQSSPWDLQTALKYRPTVVAPGDTIYLRGGVYKGMFTSEIVGAPGAPVTVMSFPGEWAVIDGNPNLVLAAPIGTGTGTIRLAGDVNLPDVATIMVDGEHMQLVNRVGNNYTINARGWNGTAVTPHAAGAVIRPVGEILTIQGSDVVFRNFEITDSKFERILQTPGSNSVDFNRRYTAINFFAPRSKVINTVIHDTGQGIGFWSQAVDSEVYGNIIYNNGEQAPDRGHGHGIYAQNSTGQKIIENNVTFGNFGGFGMQVYGSSNSQIRGFSLNGNINFLNEFLVGGNAPADDIKLNGNLLYGSGLRLGYGNPDNGAVSVVNNYVYSSVPAEIQWWKRVVMTGNRFYQNGDPQGGSAVLNLPAGPSVLPQYQINNNNYIYGKSYLDMPFYVKTPTLSAYNFSQWQQLGFDVNGTWQGATATNPTIAKPTGIDIFYVPNKYEQGRAHIAVYNYNRAPSFTVDLSRAGLTPGTRFEIRNAQNFKAPPLFAGTFNGQPLTISTGSLQVAQPSGNSTVRNPMSISSRFSVLVVIPIR